MATEISQRAMEVVRARIEGAAAAAKEHASSRLLRELEEEHENAQLKAAKRVGPSCATMAPAVDAQAPLCTPAPVCASCGDT